MPSTSSTFGAAAYGGPGWSGRDTTARQEIGSLWRACGQTSEWEPLREIMLHCPGPELTLRGDANAAQMISAPDPVRAGEEVEVQRRLAALGYSETKYRLWPKFPADS